MENKPKLIITAIPNKENMQAMQSYLENAGFCSKIWRSIC